MKKLIIVLIISLILSIVLLIFVSNRKTNLYIVIQDIKGYNYTFNDSIPQNINKLVITQDGELSYQRWEIEVNSTGIRKIALTEQLTNLTCSPYFIIKNFGSTRRVVTDLDQFDLFLVKWEEEEPYILPVKNIHFITE